MQPIELLHHNVPGAGAFRARCEPQRRLPLD